MVRILATQIIDMKCHQGMVNHALEKFPDQVDIKGANRRPRKLNAKNQPRTTGKINDNTRQGLIKRHIGMAVAAQPFFVAQRFAQRLTEGNADILDRMMRIDMQITFGLNLKINQPMASHLLKHVIKKRNPRREPALTGPIKVQANPDLGFKGVSANISVPHGDPVTNKHV